MTTRDIPTWDDLVDLLHAYDPYNSFSGQQTHIWTDLLTLRQKETLQWVRDHPTKAHIRVAKAQQAEREFEAQQAEYLAARVAPAASSTTIRPAEQLVPTTVPAAKPKRTTKKAKS